MFDGSYGTIAWSSDCETQTFRVAVNISVHFAACRLVATVPLTRRWGPRIPQKSAITTLQTKSVSPLPFVWQVQKWPSPVRGDIWDRRHKAKALNKNHPFWSQRGQRGERFCCSSGAGRPAGQPASDRQSSFFLPPLHSFYFINLTSPLPFHTSDGTSPRLSLTSPKSHCVWRPTSAAVPSFFFLSLCAGGVYQDGLKVTNIGEVRGDSYTAIYSSISPGK